MLPVIINESGERVIAATRRPDGTWRKEKKVREGYTPQDQQPVYQSRGTVAKQGTPLCPGMDDSEVVALRNQAAAAKSAAAKKNEKRKEKKNSGEKASEAQDISDKMKSLSTNITHQSAKPQIKVNPPASPPAVEEDPQIKMEKEIRKLRKKIRECDSLSDKCANNEPLTEPEKEKLKKLSLWHEELKGLEGQLAAATS